MRSGESRKGRAFRLGLMRRTGGSFEFKAACIVGLAADGGVFVSPYSGTEGWTYGAVDQVPGTERALAQMLLTPKLHYHRSGIASVTLTHHEFERRSLRLPPLSSIDRAQILSVSAIRTWELPSRPKSAERGDLLTAVRRWPDLASWSIFWLRAIPSQREDLLIPEIESVGLLAGESFTHGIVSLAAHGHQALLLIAVSIEDSWGGLPASGGTAVAALPWHPEFPREDDRCFGLWSTSLANPLIAWAESVPDSLQPATTTSVKPLGTECDRLAATAAPEEGLPWRTGSTHGAATSG